MEQRADTITVRGTGTAKATPDTTKISLKIKSAYKTYAEANAQAAAGNIELKQALKGLQIPKCSLRTTKFWIFGRNYPDGREYLLEQELEIEFPFDPAHTAKVLAEMGKIWGGMSVTVHFLCASLNDHKQRALQAAVADAREKAEAIAAALGRKLLDIVCADGGILNLSAPDFETREYREVFEGEQVVDTTPRDIEIAQTVETLWQLG